MPEGRLYTSTIIHVMLYEPILICDFRPSVSCDSSSQPVKDKDVYVMVSKRVIIHYILLYIDAMLKCIKYKTCGMQQKGNKYHDHLRGELSGEPKADDGLSNLFRRRSSSCCSVNAFCL